jgi:hypothetical protein
VLGFSHGRTESAAFAQGTFALNERRFGMLATMRTTSPETLA